MTAGVLSGFLKFAAVAIVTVGFGGGVYLVAEQGGSGDGNGAPSTLGEQLSPPNEIDGDPLSPPNQVVAPTASSTPLPTITPVGPLPTTPLIDTTDWLTYSSRIGFDIAHPPTWLVTESEVPSDASLYPARISMQHPEGTGEIIAEGGTVRLPPGVTHVWIEIIRIAGVSPAAIEDRLDGCQTEEPQAERPDRIRVGSSLMISGFRTGRCFTQELDRSEQHLVTVDSYTVELPSGSIVKLSAYTLGDYQATFALVSAVISSLSAPASQ